MTAQLQRVNLAREHGAAGCRLCFGKLERQADQTIYTWRNYGQIYVFKQQEARTQQCPVDGKAAISISLNGEIINSEQLTCTLCQPVRSINGHSGMVRLV